MAKRRKRVSYPGLLNDIMFKIVFGGTQSEAVLRHLLNALLDLNGPDKVVELAILSPNPEKFYFDDKGPILDLRARDRKGGYTWRCN
ncbi:MAG: PD-(D/E)XK nuclease family transposase [Vulcanimicrobiota bacterium]